MRLLDDSSGGSVTELQFFSKGRAEELESAPIHQLQIPRVHLLATLMEQIETEHANLALLNDLSARICDHEVSF